jgi:mycoredoxin
MDQVTVYGADWCGDTRETQMHLDELGVPYRYIDVERDPAAREWVLRQNDGKQKTPTVDVGGFVLSVPSNGELDAGLRRQGLISRAVVEELETPPAENAGI